MAKRRKDNTMAKRKWTKGQTTPWPKEEEQTTQWPKENEQKDRQHHRQKKKNRQHRGKKKKNRQYYLITNPLTSHE
jgi:hypothetical protein